MTSFRVEVAYRFKKGRGGRVVGMSIEAHDAEDAIDRAVAKHVEPYPSRVLIQCTAEDLIRTV